MSWQVSVARHGTEQQPVVVIDSFVERPERFIDDASFLGFRPMGEHYPGVRAMVPPALTMPLMAALEPIIAEVFGLIGTAITDAFYSLVTTRPEALTPTQRLPHFDGVEPERLALLHYLTPGGAGGTAFYRHRVTGFETVTADRLPGYRAALDADLRREGLPDAAYISGDTSVFEQIARHDGIFNRAILYRGNTLHCADLPPTPSYSADPNGGRLTVNIFLAGHC